MRLTIRERDDKEFPSMTTNRSLSHPFRGGMTNYGHQAFNLKWMLPVCSGSVDKWIANDSNHINMASGLQGLNLKYYLKTLELYYLFTQDNNKNLKKNIKRT